MKSEKAAGKYLERINGKDPDALHPEKQHPVSSADLSKQAKSNLTRLAAWINDRNLPFRITSIGMIVMLLWAGSYKMTRPGAEGIIPLVSNSPLIWWHFKLFGPYIGSDLIGVTEWLSAVLIMAGYFRPKAGKDVMNLGVSLYLTSYFGKKAILSENKS